MMDFYQYMVWLLQQLNDTVLKQSEKIAQFEQTLAAINEQMKRLEVGPKNHIEKIEYHFDQLKVERLDGTLTIGISPSDTGIIESMDMQQKHAEDVSIGGTPSANPIDPVHDQLCSYIRQTIPSMLENKAEERQVELLPTDKEKVVDDMIRQIDERIRVYVQHFRSNERVSEESVEASVIEQVKQDVHLALDRYVDYFGERELT